MGKKNIAFFFILACIFESGGASSIRNIASSQYKLFSDGQQNWIINESFIGKWFSFPIIATAKADIRSDVVLWAVGAGTVIVWPNNLYSEISYSFGFPQMLPLYQQAEDGPSYAHDIYLDVTAEIPKFLLNGGLRGHYDDEGIAAMAFGGIRWYFLSGFDLWLKNFFAWSEDEGINDSIWVELQWQVTNTFSAKLGGTLGTYRNPIDYNALGLQGSGILGWRWVIVPRLKLSHVFEYVSNSRRDCISNTIV